MQHVLDSMVALIAPEMTNHTGKWGGSVAQWSQNVIDTKNWIDQRCLLIQQGLDNCFTLTGPYPVVFDVMPPLSGAMKINSINQQVFSFSGNYYGNIDILLKAKANAGYTFDYWEYHHGTLLPTINDTAVALQVTQGDTVIAHFRLINPPPPPPPPPVEGAVVVPTGFSPNGDGNNDILFVLGSDIEKFELNIYNRWGQRVFHTTDQANGWDGTFKGQKENNGVFAYSLVYTTFDKTEHSLKGNITLIR